MRSHFGDTVWKAASEEAGGVDASPSTSAHNVKNLGQENTMVLHDWSRCLEATVVAQMESDACLWTSL